MHYKIILWLSLPLWAFHCSNSQSKQTVDDSYPFKKINGYIRYLQQNRELQAEMTFRTDSTVAINGPVTVNEKPMRSKILPNVGTQYRLLENALSFDSSYTFEYTELNGHLRGLSISMNRFDKPTVLGQQISRTLGGVLAWEGSPLSKEDGLILIFTDAEGQTFSVNHSGISRGNKFEIVTEYAKRLSNGPAKLLITRKKTTLVHHNDCSTLLCVEYYHVPVLFDVID